MRRTMRRRVTVAALAVLAGCGAAPVTAPASRGGPDHPAVQATLPGRPTCPATTAAENRRAAEATNAARKARNLPPVAPDNRLARAAAAQACDMAAGG